MPSSMPIYLMCAMIAFTSHRSVRVRHVTCTGRYEEDLGEKIRLQVTPPPPPPLLMPFLFFVSNLLCFHDL